MSDNVENVTIETLRNIQSDIADLKRSFDEFKNEVRADRRKDRRSVAGMLVMMQATPGDFDQRVTEIEQRVMALEGGAP